MADSQSHDLLILLDATASMDSYVRALNSSLPQIVSLAALTDCFTQIGILAYRDYDCSGELLSWSGWCTTASTDSQTALLDFARDLKTHGGYSIPEAVKTGLAKAYENIRKDASTLVLLYADAPPHLSSDRQGSEAQHHTEEQTALSSPTIYGGYGPAFADWTSAARTLKHGEKNIQLICMIDSRHYRGGAFDYLASVVDGACIYSNNLSSRSISETTIDVLLGWMGVGKDGSAERPLAWFIRRQPRDLDHNEPGIVDELDPRLRYLFGHTRLDSPEQVFLSSSNLKQFLPARSSTLPDLSKTYQTDNDYRALVQTHLRQIMQYDVTAITLNPVFGSLWRTVCNDRLYSGRQELMDLFGRKVDQTKDATSRENLRLWLEESYDYTAEVVEIVNKVPRGLRFPCVCLDPTLSFTTQDSEEDTRTMKREDLLEIGRSCDYKTLKRLGSVLTRLTYIDAEDKMPAHLVNEKDLVKVPIALASKEYGEQFWRILLHTVVPGTLLGRRASVVLAALSIRIGVQPLKQAAEEAMLSWRDRWLNIEVPETWNVSCLSLLIEADNAHGLGLLKSSDKALFECLIEYKMLELNLDTTLTARIAWAPEKIAMAIGPIVECRVCKHPRSVTIMGRKGVCGVCCFYSDPDNTSDLSNAQHAATGVRATDNGETNATWCECSVPSCRAQYVVYHVEGLNVRPKCYYCRVGSTAPTVQCTRCTSRMIWPSEYRTADTEPDSFLCMGCKTGRQTIVDEDTTAKKLCVENGTEWLLQNRDNQIKEVFSNRSLFHVASSCVALESFSADVRILPGSDVELNIRGKQVQNPREVVEQIRRWISQRRTQSGQCSVCFASRRKNDLLPACGRSGCSQRVCKGCLQGWYGLNMPGRIINIAALHCPFCRRDPTAKTLAKNGMGIHAVGNLTAAVECSGEWIYAWCVDCGMAGQYVERVCARGAPTDVHSWSCEQCQLAKGVGDLLKTKPCPRCGIMTEKTGGCDHIQCQVPTCAAHWCFYCGKEESETSIYDHMQREHGGYYAGRAAHDYESDENEEVEDDEDWP